MAGAFEFTPTVYPDQRGVFVPTFQEHTFQDTVGHRFPLVQSAYSVSARGVLRGVHYTMTPPGMAKYVYCAKGRAMDFVVDLRVGSPTFGKWDAVLLDQADYRCTYLPVGVGHAYLALDDDTMMVYTMSQGYVLEHELAISALDPAIGLPIDVDTDLILSPRDRDAPTLAGAKAAGMLPDYATSLELEAAL
ncbi:dTDP-4-dehydrorhamnose 3,5-epimerase family protein [Kitasatospora sp. NBC_01302]|uniref:dTDP-4-dehydrorhamnose 3,5-epimerase family protein n=1 Tax=Kitasatospora sp. NBC_01302 TaxID=2903575 RepID=UPI002E115F97